MRVITERAGIVGFCWLEQPTLNLGPRLLKPIETLPRDGSPEIGDFGELGR